MWAGFANDEVMTVSSKKYEGIGMIKQQQTKTFHSFDSAKKLCTNLMKQAIIN